MQDNDVFDPLAGGLHCLSKMELSAVERTTLMKNLKPHKSHKFVGFFCKRKEGRKESPLVLFIARNTKEHSCPMYTHETAWT